ncbi:MAG TPA: D-alanyl-D-alanine carboxypeptidase/D-alanyl-D-alanine-endopeptidase, partial [Gemmatimonadaceae bacterium]|nr:D-alanyl-D-alanine carboxypeptidase/D-alanyl-D-alanine-endopeptidase [Gemmatimonadaceae bacterium]
SYSAPSDELLFNEGFTDLRVRGGDRPGAPVHVDLEPAHSYPHVRVQAMTAAAPADVAGGGHNTLRAVPDSTTWDIVLEGTIAPNDTATLEVPHHDADHAYVAAVAEALRGRGVSIDGAETPAATRMDTVATLSSPPVREILPALLKPSQNQIAEMLFRTLALQATGIGRSDTAAAVVARQLARWGVPSNEVVIRDGSGLSRYDYVSPRTLVRVLDAVRHLPGFTAYYDALPIAGVDGTIQTRMRGTAAENNVHAKTGSIAMARSLSGYVTTANHRILIFSFLCNNWTVPVRSVERVQDAIAARLAAMQLR